DPTRAWCGTDTFARPVEIDFATTPGLRVHGRTGSGRTTFVRNLLTHLAPHPDLEFFVLDGSTPDPRTGGYRSLADRCTKLVGDDLAAANKLLTGLAAQRRQRAAAIGYPQIGLGTPDYWEQGPTVDWPMWIVVIDGYSTFLAPAQGRSAAARARTALARENRDAVLDLLINGPRVGIAVVLTTGETLPKDLRDHLTVTISLACDPEQVTNALGAKIRSHPAANPAGFRHIDMATMTTPAGGYIQLRVPLTPAPELAPSAGSDPADPPDPTDPGGPTDPAGDAGVGGAESSRPSADPTTATPLALPAAPPH
ncbi:FtsK/SpoIIIE domain-containing protein, partial [Nocardia sp. CA-084685]